MSSSATSVELDKTEQRKLERALRQSISIEKKGAVDTVNRFAIKVMQAGRSRTKQARKYRDVEQNPNWKKGGKNARYRIVRYTQSGVRYIPKRKAKKAGDPRVLISNKGLAKSSWTWALWRMNNRTGKLASTRQKVQRFVRVRKIQRAAYYAVKLVIELAYIKIIAPGVERIAIMSAVNSILKVQEKKLQKKLQRQFEK